jgi:hypothetical protein
MPQLYGTPSGARVIRALTVIHFPGTSKVNTEMYYTQAFKTAGGWYHNMKDVPPVLNSLRREYRAGTLERLEPHDCLNQYATAIQSDRRHLLLVAADEKFPRIEENRFMNGSHVYWGLPFYANAASSSGHAANAYDWVCTGLHKTGSCSSLVAELRPQDVAWTVGADCPRGRGKQCEQNHDTTYMRNFLT